jgi:hypothetical protein
VSTPRQPLSPSGRVAAAKQVTAALDILADPRLGDISRRVAAEVVAEAVEQLRRPPAKSDR